MAGTATELHVLDCFAFGFNDLSAWYASVEKLRGIAEQTDANVIFGHDAEQLWSLRRSPDGHYT
jgi:glyoxylase-like metal-dependent hydrolase (beta-lactamase superfamily II)